VGHLVAAIGENRLGGVAVADSGLGPSGHPAQRRHYTSGAGDKSRRLSFKGLGTKVATSMLGPDGQKALAPSGATIVGQEFVRDPVAFGHVAQSLLDVLPVKQHASTEYAYLRQTTPTSNAAVVAEGATKPTSIYSVTRIEGALVVVAHLSEGIPRFWLLDNSALETFVENELQYGLQVAVEAKVLADVNGTSGIQTQTYSTSVLTTLRKGQTKLEVSGYTASSIVRYRCAHFDS
jgi:hypothetical protein